MPTQGSQVLVTQAHGSGGDGLGGQVAGDDPGIVGAQGAAHPGGQHPGEGVRGDVRGQSAVGAGADIDGNAAFRQQREGGVVGPEAMDDAGDPAFQDGLADVGSRAILPGMGRDAKACGARPVEDGGPLPKGRALQTSGGKALHEGGELRQHQIEDRVPVLGPEVVDRVQHHTAGQAPGAGFREAFFQAEPEVLEGDLSPMDHQEMGGNPEVEACSARIPGAACGGEGCLPHRAAAVQQGRAEQEGLDEALKGSRGALPQADQAGRYRPAATLGFGPHPDGIKGTLQVRVAVDEGRANKYCNRR